MYKQLSSSHQSETQQILLKISLKSTAAGFFFFSPSIPGDLKREEEWRVFIIHSESKESLKSISSDDTWKKKNRLGVVCLLSEDPAWPQNHSAGSNRNSYMYLIAVHHCRWMNVSYTLSRNFNAWTSRLVRFPHHHHHRNNFPILFFFFNFLTFSPTSRRIGCVSGLFFLFPPLTEKKNK